MALVFRPQPLQLPQTIEEYPQHHLFPPPSLLTTASTAAQQVGRYCSSLSELEKLQVLGEGKEGTTVYKVSHSSTEAFYALKVINHNNNTHDDDHVLEEIGILSSMDSPFIIGFRGVFTETFSHQVSILMEYMDAGTLDNLVKNDGPFSETMVAKVAQQSLMGLNYLHNIKKIVHCDIKPSNLLVNQRMEVKIADFGLSKMVSSTSLNDPREFFVGTTAYMSPERFDSSNIDNTTFGKDDVFAGDIWSLGLTLMEIYIGYQPYSPPGQKPNYTNFDLVSDICFEEPPRLPRDASLNFQDFMACCLQKEPSKRWTAAQLLSHPFLTHA